MKIHTLTSQRVSLTQQGAQTRRSQRRKTHKPPTSNIAIQIQNPYNHNQNIPANIKRQLQQFKYVSMEIINTLDFEIPEGGERLVWSMREAACMQQQQFMDFINIRNHARGDTIRQQRYDDEGHNPQQQVSNNQQPQMVKSTENYKVRGQSNKHSSKNKEKQKQAQQSNYVNNQLDSLIEEDYNQNLSYSCPYRLQGQLREEKILFQDHNCNHINANSNLNVNMTANINYYPNFKDDYQSFFF